MKRILRFISLNIILVLFDQLTKYLAQAKLMGTNGISIIDGVFKLFYLENRGAAFGMLQNKQILFIIITIIMYVGILYVYIRIPANKRYLPLQYIAIFVSAGAIGNLIDRLLHKYVIDFLYIEWIDFPVFNVADCYVTISSALLLILCFFYYKEDDFTFLFTEKKEPKKNA